MAMGNMAKNMAMRRSLLLTPSPAPPSAPSHCPNLACANPLPIIIISARRLRCSAHDAHACVDADPQEKKKSRRGLLTQVGFATTGVSLISSFNSDLGLGLGLGLGLAEEASSPDCTVTDKVYMDIVKCPSTFSTSRDNANVTPPSPSPSPSPSSSSTTMSPSSSSPMSYCNDHESVGRIVIGLYGKQVPETVAIFKAMCTGQAGSSYKGCLFHRVLPGQYIMAGKQGFSKEKGEIIPPTRLPRNLESVKPEAFALQHLRPGTVSLCLSENDDDDQFRLSTDYRNVEFLITTGPGPAPQLDNKNIVFGVVLEGLDVVRALATVPTYKPGERIRQLNELATFLGDERASNARNFWYRPLSALYISDCGEL